MRLLLILSLGTFLFGCQSRSSVESPLSSLQVRKVGSHELRLKDQTTQYYKSMQYVEDENLLILLDEYTQALDFYYNDELERSLVLPHDGSDGFGKVIGFLYHNADSIFIHPHRRAKIYLIDSKAKIIDIIEYKTDKAGKEINPSKPWSKVQQSMIYGDGMLHLALIPIGRWDEHNTMDSPILATIDLISRKTTLHGLGYPTNYWTGGNLVSAYFNRIRIGEMMVFSFFPDENLYITDLSQARWTGKHKRKSQYIAHIQPYNNQNSYLKDVIESPSYNGIYYHEGTKVLYQLCYLGEETTKGSNLMDLAQHPSKFSLMALDSTFKIIDEIQLPVYTYTPYMAFTSERGFHIARNHPNLTEMEEDILVFDIYSIE